MNKVVYKKTKLKTLIARLNYFVALLKVRLFNKLDPIICVIIVNHKCNFDCNYCFGDYPNRKDTDYTTEELKQLIDELYNLGTRYLNIHGGETLLRSDIGEIVDYIKGKGMYCCLITNGSLLEQKLDQIRNIDNITISLDGMRENNDINRGEGTYEIAVNAIKLAKKEDLPLRISATITKASINDIGYLAKFAQEVNCTVHFSILYKPLEKALHLQMTNEEVKQALQEIVKYKKMGYPIFTSDRNIEYSMGWPLDHNEYHYVQKKDMDKLPPDFKPIKCYYSKNKFIIEGDGSIYPCPLFNEPEKFDALNWKEVGVKKAIEHVQKTNTCITCPCLTQNDHNLLFSLDPKQIMHVILDQVAEPFRKFKR